MAESVPCCYLVRVKSRSTQDNEDGQLILFTEVIRYIAMIVPIYLSTWIYCEFKGYAEFIPSANCTSGDDSGTVSDACATQFWGIFTLIFCLITLLVYSPVKLYFSYTPLWEARYMYGWRPSVLCYLLLCALPCFVTIIIAVVTSDKGASMTTIDTRTLAVIQVVVLGLTITEWMAKVREEILSYDLAVAMSVDFFFAYDVFDFFYMFLHIEDIFHTDWFYVTFVFAFIAMFRYLPNQSTGFDDNDKADAATYCILASMLCNDVPFVIIRISTMVEYGLMASDIIHPAKNVAMISFSLIQLFMIYKNREQRVLRRNPTFPEHRCSRQVSMTSQADVTMTSPGDVCLDQHMKGVTEEE